MAFSWGNIVGSLSDSWRLSQWGLFGMPVFIVVLAYLIIRFNAFNIKIISTQILVTAFPILVGSQYFLAQSFGSKLITVITFLLSVIAGIFIVKSVEREVAQREKIEKLALDLEHANSRLRELDQMKSQFLSFASHQIRSPLTAIKGYSSLLLEGDYGKIPAKISEAIKIIDTSTQSLIVIVNEFLDVSRIEQGRMKYDFTDFDIRKLVEEIVAEQKPNVEKKGLTLSYSANQNATYSVHADMGKIKQVLGNVLDNAIKYTPQGSISVNVEKNMKKIHVSITDTGVGLDPEDISKLFSMFSRAKDASKANVSGTGLGLYVAKQMLEAQKGKIWVDSPGKCKGSTFHIEIEEK
jgi:signal transduction histidine kinase